MSEEMIEERIRTLNGLSAEFTRWLEKGPNEQPHYANGMRPFSTGDLKAFIAALSAYNPNERLREAESLLKQALEAIESARSEPLFIMRDAIRNFIEGEE